MFGNLKSKVSSQGFTPQSFKREKEEPRRPQPRRESNNVHYHNGSTIHVDISGLVDSFCKLKSYAEQRRRRDQEINLDILGLAKICDGVISVLDIMIHLALTRRHAQKRIRRFLAHGYCRVIDKVQDEELYLFEALLPEPKHCHYCGTLYRKDGAPEECHNCGAPT